MDLTSLPEQGLSQTTENVTQEGSTTHEQTGLAPSTYELDKLEKFKFQGQEYTPKDLEKAILRQKDYTLKTQSISEERKALEKDKEYYDNLYVDLERIKSDPSLLSKFLEIYPQKFHSYAKRIMSGTETATSQNANKPDVDLMSKVQDLESKWKKQEVEKNTLEIRSTIEKLSSKYEDANREVVLSRIYELANQNISITDQIWEDTFKRVDSEMKTWLKTRYGENVKKQTEANSKAKGVDAGGGTVGRAPVKFSRLKDVKAHMLASEGMTD